MSLHLIKAFKDVRWRLNDIRDMLMERGVGGERLYGCDEWSTPTVNLAKAIEVADTALRESDWFPIETAPKDHDIMLSDGVRVSQGGWMSDVDQGAEWEGQIGMAGWYAYQWPGTSEGVIPTHWQPLPNPSINDRRERIEKAVGDVLGWKKQTPSEEGAAPDETKPAGR